MTQTVTCARILAYMRANPGDKTDKELSEALKEFHNPSAITKARNDLRREGLIEPVDEITVRGGRRAFAWRLV